MPERFSRITSESALREQLRREATESRPVFSETLHRRILAAVQERRAERATDGGSPPLASHQADAQRRRKRTLMAWAAAACFLCAAAIGWQLSEMRESRRPLAKKSPMADLLVVNDLADSAVAGLDGLAASVELTLPPPDLSADVQSTAEALMQRLPVDLELASE
jgi:hypothetical protein